MRCSSRAKCLPQDISADKSPRRCWTGCYPLDSAHCSSMCRVRRAALSPRTGPPSQLCSRPLLRRIPWACNPLISALTVLAIHRLTFRLLGSVEAAGLSGTAHGRIARFFADGISYYSMQAHLLANTVYVILLIQPTARRAFLAGIVGSIALTLHTPVPHLLFAIPWVIWIVRRPGNARLLGWLILGYLPLCLLLGAGWFVFFAANLMHRG